MNDKTTLWAIGGLAVVGAAVGATVLIMQKKPQLAAETVAVTPRGVSPTGAGGSSGIEITPSLQPVAVTLGIPPAPTPPPYSPLVAPPIAANLSGNQAATANNLAALQAAEIAREQAAAVARAAQERANTLARMRSNLNNVENQQLLLLTQIKSIQTSEIGLNDFEQMAFRILWASPEAKRDIVVCNTAQWLKCDSQFNGYIFHGALSEANCQKTKPYCETDVPDYARNNPASKYWQIAQSRNDKRSGYALLEKDRMVRRMPLEADLQRLEVQYQGLFNELLGMGETYQPAVPQAHTNQAVSTSRVGTGTKTLSA